LTTIRPDLEAIENLATKISFLVDSETEVKGVVNKVIALASTIAMFCDAACEQLPKKAAKEVIEDTRMALSKLSEELSLMELDLSPREDMI
jgi:hypothetical protein